MSDDPPVMRNTAPVLLPAAGDTRAVIGADWAPPPLVAQARPGGRAGTMGWLAGGLAVLLASWLGLSAVTFVADLFQRSSTLGAAGLAGFGLGAALLAVAATVETRAWRSLARVEKLRTTLSGDSLPAMRAGATGWVGGLTRVADPGRLRADIAAAPSAEALRALLRERVSTPLAADSGAIGRQAALEGAALVAILPHPALDALFAGLRGLRVIRQVAALYGLKPGTFASLALIRHVALSAATTAGADLLAQTVADKALGALPGIRHLAEAVPGASVAALRLYRLARITASECDPLPPK